MCIFVQLRKGGLLLKRLGGAQKSQHCRYSQAQDIRSSPDRLLP